MPFESRLRQPRFIRRLSFIRPRFLKSRLSAATPPRFSRPGFRCSAVVSAESFLPAAAFPRSFLPARLLLLRLGSPFSPLVSSWRGFFLQLLLSPRFFSYISSFLRVFPLL